VPRIGCAEKSAGDTKLWWKRALDAGQPQQLPKRQTKQQPRKNHEHNANGLETEALSDGGN